tara:strand:- start:44690 stop:47620 length:2931 start_codon:yes stop_codon:yes gene_type:complete
MKATGTQNIHPTGIMSSVKRALTIANRELTSMFRVPAGWIIIALFAFLTGVLFVNQTIVPGNIGTMRYFFAYSGWLLIPIAPAISMKLMSEEYKSGSFESLRTAPAGDWSVTIGKYLGSLAFLVLMLVPTLVYPLVLMSVSNPAPDIGPIVAGYLMLILVGMLYLGIGMLASSLTSSQMLAFLGTMMTLILMMVLTSALADQVSVEMGIFLSNFSITDRVMELSKGIIDTSTISFFLIGSIWMLVLAAGVLEVRRLGRSRLFTSITGAIFFIATCSCVILAGHITNTYHIRTDVTSTGTHKLSARSQGIVNRVTDPTEIVLAIGMNQADRRSIDLVSDVLDAYDQSSEQIRVRIIDLDSAEGVSQTKALLADLATRESETIQSNLASLTQSAELMLELSPALDSIANGLDRVANAISLNTQADTNNRAFFEQLAPIMRVYTRDVKLQGTQIQSEIQKHTTSNSGEIFPFDRFAEPIEQSLAKLMAQLDSLVTEIDAFANADELDPTPRAVARPMINQLRDLRDQVAIAHNRINRLDRVRALSVGRALETGEALLVIGDGTISTNSAGVAAIDLDSLLPSSALLEQAGVSAAGIIGPRAQDLIASALAQLVAPTQPILIYIHGGKQGDLLQTTNIFTKSTDKLAQRGIDTLEWAAIEEPTPPDMDLLDPLGIRPVVFALLSVDSTSKTDQSGLTGAKRATAMGDIVSTLIQQGESIIVSLNPSIFPTYGDPDPIAQALTEFGIIPDSGTTLLHDQIGKNGTRIADPITRVIPDPDTDNEQVHPIANALSGLSTVLPWAIPMHIEERTGVETWPIIELAGDNSTWAESDWIRQWSTPAQSRHLLPNQPEFNPRGDRPDVRSDNWLLAAAGERTLAGTNQRIIVIGSNGWSSDAINADTQRLVDGRITTAWPGNSTLLDSSIAWLSHMDDLIGPGTQARPIATIKNIDPKQRSLIRWMMLAGLPGFILIIGMATRLIFG